MSRRELGVLALIALCSVSACRKLRAPTPRPIEDVVAIPGGDFIGNAVSCPQDLQHVDRDWLDNWYRTHVASVPQTVEAFEIERRQVAAQDYDDCVAAGVCKPGDESNSASSDREPRRPRLAVTFDNAERLCAWRGGRLPTLSELQRALRGAAGMASPPVPDPRYPYHRCGPRMEDDAFCDVSSPDGVIYTGGGFGPALKEWTSTVGCGFPGHNPNGQLVREHIVQGLLHLDLISYGDLGNAAAFRCVRPRGATKQ